ncbi:uncharacterized protein PGTG_03955 [Puccinia graminis f. sp. tritici CRL 75-36-700-3]|uniref:DDE Tnp4 domain-containing protein n=1 Tax=Puccinia graminis f. sp. tritici (strain CRL 75-36-700-3 / race SCCL) TaxID=418459 RepID=E3K124_PUCGT|nr:uncharacterized protein PGTG_03955 [Puccinia graminis f. sp. tritici CRL 75-36-700-3]EFP77999.1 hypothetical protein PGTG_03955 [Puccinia graminis f. sp. tritici CRL 75-36-700-3]
MEILRWINACVALHNMLAHLGDSWDEMDLAGEDGGLEAAAMVQQQASHVTYSAPSPQPTSSLPALSHCTYKTIAEAWKEISKSTADNSTTRLTLNASVKSRSSSNKIYACIDAQVWLPEMGQAHFLDGSSQVIAFEIDCQSSSSSSSSFNGLSFSPHSNLKMSTAPATVKEVVAIHELMEESLGRISGLTRMQSVRRVRDGGPEHELLPRRELGAVWTELCAQSGLSLGLTGDSQGADQPAPLATRSSHPSTHPS